MLQFYQKGRDITVDKIEQAKMNAMDILKEVKPIYQENLNNNFDLDENTRESLKSFFDNTSEYVLMKSLSEYQEKLLKHKEKNNISNFTIEVLAISKYNMTKSARLYLLSLYIDKLVEYDFESLGLTSIDIIKKYTAYQDIDEHIVYGMLDIFREPDGCYKLKLGFSPLKLCIKENQHNSKMKVYGQMIEE